MCFSKALCGDTENKNTETPQGKKKTALKPEKSAFKAKKTKRLKQSKELKLKS